MKDGADVHSLFLWEWHIERKKACYNAKNTLKTLMYYRRCKYFCDELKKG